MPTACKLLLRAYSMTDSSTEIISPGCKSNLNGVFTTRVQLTQYIRIFVAADCTALTGLWSYWFPDINPGVWVACTLSVVFVLNCLAVKYFGEVEFCASIFKVFLVIGFLLFAFIVVVGGNPQHDRIGFRYWYDPGAFNTQYVDGNAGRFLAIWGVFNTAAFAIGGPDFIANCAPEAINPRRNIPKAVRRVIYRLIFFFILSVFAVGLLVPYNDPVMCK